MGGGGRGAKNIHNRRFVSRVLDPSLPKSPSHTHTHLLVAFSSLFFPALLFSTPSADACILGSDFGR